MKRSEIACYSVLCSGLFALVSCGLPSPQEDIRLGREVADAMEAQIGRYENESIEAYVDSVASRVEQQIGDTPFTYSYSLLDQPEPNAFAAPGGYVYVSRGLLALARSEDEIAGVLGHEMIHVEQRHSMKQMSRGILPAILSLPGRIIGNLLSQDLGHIINTPVNYLGALRQARYGRGQESESDELGQGLVAAAGYDPASLASILERMESFAESLTGEARRPSFFDSHPPTPERSLDVRNHAMELTVAPRSPEALGEDAFLERIDGLTWGPNPQQGEFRGETFLHPDLDIALTFPEGWQTMNTATMAGAVAPDGKALTFYGIVGKGDNKDLKRLADERREELARVAGVQPSIDEERDLGGRPVRVLAFTDNSGQEPVHIFFGWVAFEGLVHQFVGMTTESHRENVRAAVGSLRTLTTSERNSFVIRRIRIVEGQDGETLAELGKRTANALDENMTAMINGLEPSSRLVKGQSIKIVKESKYSP